jgi:hypothetical protein
LCQDDFFWRDKVEHDYQVAEYKPENETYHDQYQAIFAITNPIDAILENRLDALIALYNNGVEITFQHANLAAEQGALEILNWMIDHNINPTRIGAHNALANGYIDVAELLFNRLNILSTFRAINAAAEGGYLNSIEWMVEKGVIPTPGSVGLATKNGFLEIVRYLADNFNILPNIRYVNDAAINGHFDILIFLESRNVIPDENSIRPIVINGNLKILKWLYEQGVIPTREDVDLAIQYKHFNIFRWALKKKILPTSNGANKLCIIPNPLSRLKQLARYGIYPSSSTADSAAFNTNIPILDWLAENNILPTQSAVDTALMRSNLQMLQWFAQHNMLPTYNMIRLYYNKVDNTIQQWLNQQGF